MQHYGISHFAFDDEYVNTILRVITIEKKQFSNYTCKAVNILGEAEGLVVLFETVVPICPPACDGYSFSYFTSGCEKIISVVRFVTSAVLFVMMLDLIH